MRLSARRAARVHARRNRRRHRLRRGAAARNARRRLAASLIHQALVETSLLGLEGDRVRSAARPRRQLHRRLQHGEHRSGRRAHRRLDRRRAVADALRPRIPDAAHREHQRHPRAERPGRLQHSVRAASAAPRVRDHRGQSARLAQLGAGVESDRLPDRQDRDAHRARPDARRDPQPGHRRHERRLRADARLLRREDSALAVRQVPARRHAARHADEVDRRGDGDRPDLSRRADQGGARPRPQPRDADRRRSSEWSDGELRGGRRAPDPRAPVRDLRAAAPRGLSGRSIGRTIAQRRSTHLRAVGDRSFLAQRDRRAVELEERLRADPIDADYAASARVGLRARERRLDRLRRDEFTARPAFRMVDTAAAEFPARSPYYYLSRGETRRDASDAARSGRRRRQRSDPHRPRDRVRLLLRPRGLGAARRRASPVVVNNNPETVSTDFDVSDVLVFEPPGADEVEAAYARPARAA